MSRASWFYVLFAIAFVAGLWLILGIANALKLKAPPDLRGKWELSPIGEIRGFDSPGPRTLLIEQSGRFLRIAFDAKTTISLKITSFSNPEQLEMQGANQRVSARRMPLGHAYEFSF